MEKKQYTKPQIKSHTIKVQNLLQTVSGSNTTGQYAKPFNDYNILLEQGE